MNISAYTQRCIPTRVSTLSLCFVFVCLFELSSSLGSLNFLFSFCVA